MQWDKWARELVELQSKYPEISKKVIWYEAFKDWDASTGAFLPITDEWVVQKAKYLLSLFKISTTEKEQVKKIPKAKEAKKVKKKSSAKALF